MSTPSFVAGTDAVLRVNFREYAGGPYINPPDARFDVVDPEGSVVASDVPTTIFFSPGRHIGTWPIPADAELGDWTMVFKATIDGQPFEQDCPFIVGSSQDVCDVWPIDPSCCDLPDDVDTATIERWQRVSTNLLYAASGRVFGPCPTTVRPCARRCLDDLVVTSPFTPGPYVPYLTDGVWRNASPCSCSGECSCSYLSEVVLDGPVSAIEAVTVGEDNVPASGYRLDRVGMEYRLVRLGGSWPDCQDLQAQCGEPGAFCVTYRRGRDLDDAGVAANSELTCELVRMCIPGCECRIPSNIQTLARSGESLTFDTAQGWIRSLPLVDAWLDAVNPDGLPRPMRVLSPDSRGPRVVG